VFHTQQLFDEELEKLKALKISCTFPQNNTIIFDYAGVTLSDFLTHNKMTPNRVFSLVLSLVCAFEYHASQSHQPIDIHEKNVCVGPVILQELREIHFWSPAIYLIDYGCWKSLNSPEECFFHVSLNDLFKHLPSKQKQLFEPQLLSTLLDSLCTYLSQQHFNKQRS
jgi:hypothetical protein